MTVQQRKAGRPRKKLAAPCGELEATIGALRQQIRALEDERDQARNGLDFLTEALRRRGCCDHPTEHVSR